MSQELPFTSEFWKRLGEYLDKYRVGGHKLKVEPLGRTSYYGKIPDIVITDERGFPQLIIETKRKRDADPEDLYDPLGKAPIAQALCYASLAMEHYNMERTPLFSTANRDVIFIFKGVEKEELKDLVDINVCKDRHPTSEDWERALKPGAYTKLISQGYLLGRLESPLKEDTIKRLFDEYVEKWISKIPITPVHLYRVLVDQLREDVERLHEEYVEDAVKTKILEDPQYFEELYNLAIEQGYPKGILSPGLFSLCVYEERSVKENVCRPLADKISEAFSKAKTVQNIFSVLKELADKKVEELVEYCKETSKNRKIPPPICSKKIKDVISFRNLSSLMTYAFAMKILAYKILELHHKIPELKPLRNIVEINGERIEIKSSDDIVNVLNIFFESASKTLERILNIKDFRPLFNTGLYDKIAFKGLKAIERVNELIEIADAIKEALRYLPGVIGYVYEGFIPPRERHQLGQFYTPPAIARLITRWAIRSGDDIVLDGGCGSGTFLIEAYKRILYLKFNKDYNISYPSCETGVNEHQEILEKLYGVDINAFATQLSSLHLMLMEPRCPFSRLNVETRDFFTLSSRREDKDKNVKIVKPFDAVIGNPPYTRWVEIPDITKDLIKERVRDLMSKYDLFADVMRGREPGIYVYWILHASKNLLKTGGRLGMIISNMWLQTDYGVDFGRFLLDNFKIKALIDISYRLFEALISTVIILAEKEPNENARKDNEVLLIRIPPIDSRLSDKEVETKLDEALKCIEDAITSDYRFGKDKLVKCVQSHGI
jgi:type I restriction-modification system DNA methylase subunit